MSLYPRILKLASEQPWALAPETLSILADVLRFRSSGQRLTDEEIRTRVQQYGSSRPPQVARERYYDTETDDMFAPAYDGEGDFIGYRSQSGAPMAAGRPVVAILSVVGIIMQRGDAFDEMSGAMSIDRLAGRFRSALNDPAVKAIVFDVDSPGGGVYGVQEFAAEVRGARATKPVLANANSLAASAGYWILSAAEEASVTESGEVGSIGVYSLHQDISKFLESEGIHYEFISAGDFKTEGNPFQPLTDEARAFMQTRVDEYYDAFLKAVAKGRDVSVAKVKSDFGQGRVFGAAQAKAAGMVDRIETLDETIRRAAGKKATTGPKALVVPAAAESPWPELNAAHVEMHQLALGLPASEKSS